MSEYSKEYYQKNKLKFQERQRAYYAANKDAVKERVKAWHEAHKEERKEKQKEYNRKFYLKHRNPDTPRKTRKQLDYVTPDWIKVIKYPNGIILIEATTEMLYDSDANSIEENSNYKIKRRLELAVKNIINNHNTIVVVERFDIQIYLNPEDKEHIQSVINVLVEFVKNKCLKLENNGC